MGTTMHAHIEVKKDGRWLHYGCPDVRRDYILFACINGTRREDFYESEPEIYNKINPVARIHKLPDDISEVTKICLATDSASCKLKGVGVLDSDDLIVLQHHLLEFKEPDGPGYDLEEDIFKSYIGGNSIVRHEGFDDSRIVFWFDN